METLDQIPSATQKHTLKRIDPWQAAKITAVITFFIILVFVLPFMLIFGAAFDALNLPGGNAIGIIVAVFLPLLYAVLAYMITGLYCMLYNFTAKRVGGIMVEVEVE